MSVGSKSAPPPIAIVGVASLFAGSSDVLSYWRDVLFAIDRISEVPSSHWLIEDYYDPDPSARDKTYCRRGGFLDPLPFDPVEFGIPPNAIPATDTAQLLALVVAKRTLADAARMRRNAVDPDRTSVILGVASTTELVVEMGSRMQAPVWRKALREAGLPESRVVEICRRIADSYTPWQESSFPGLLGNVVAGRIANRLGLGGTNCVTDAACASSLSAVQAAVNELYLGDSDLVLAGGVDALNDIMMFMCFSKTPAFSATGDCRPFSDKADGTIIGEGVGMVALRRLEDAERDGDAVYAVIRGIGSSSDGRAASVYAPRAEGQANALRRAYDKAGYSPATVELLEAHGTGTKAGDLAEFKGASSIFAPTALGKTQWCAIGSVKSQLGHTKAAAGAAGLIKAALALQHGILPPTLKVERPNPALAMETSPFYINTKARPWIRAHDHPRRASVSSFGFGGSNFHLTLEEYVGSGARAPRLRTWPEELVLLSAQSETELASKASALAPATKEPLARIAERSHAEFDAGAPVRLALVAATLAKLQSLARRAADALQSGTADSVRDGDIVFGFDAPRPGRLAFLFPGQGSQYVGMGAGVAMAFERAREVWDRAADLPEFNAEGLHRLVFPPPAFSQDALKVQEQHLTRMANAQPAIGVASLAYLRLLESAGVEADAVAGHSFGEITALAAAGAMDDDLLAKLARRRGILMTDAASAREGAMLAVSASADEVHRLSDLATHGLVLANDNAPGQVVIAGETGAIAEIEPTLKAAGLTTARLPVATAFHSSLVAESCGPFQQYLAAAALTRPRIPVYGNSRAEPYPESVDDMRSLLAGQIAKPVRFRDMIERMYADGITRFIEVGPGRVLTGLVDRCLAEREHLAVALDDKKLSGLRAFWRGLGQMAVSGIAVNFEAFSKGYDLPPMPSEPPAHAVMISGANYDKPYPPKTGAAGLPPPNPEVIPEPSVMPAQQMSPAVERGPSPSISASVPNGDVRSAGAASASVPDANMDRFGADSSLIERFQRETLEAHRQYQTLMAESHKAFLEMATQAMGQLAGIDMTSTSMDRQTGHAEAVAAPPANVMPAASVVAPPSETTQATAGQHPVSPDTETSLAPPESTSARQPGADVEAVVMEIVAEKTGYPVSMLDPNIEMEAGLGIDSIKQVEILAALQERLPGIPEISPSELADLKTLSDVMNRLGAGDNIEPGSEHATQCGPVSQSSTTSIPAKPRATTSSNAEEPEHLLSVVAEKTGYPIDMLDLDIEMEAGLGIDSIKQVEILAALHERMPNLPEIAPSELACLKTLRDVLGRIRNASGKQIGEPASREEPLAGGMGGVRFVPPQRSSHRLPDAQEVQPARLNAHAPVCVPMPAPGFALAGLHDKKRIFITNEHPHLAEALAAALSQRNMKAEIVGAVPEGAEAVISLAALGAVDGPDASLQAHLNALQAARMVARSAPAEARLLVTVQSTGGDFGLNSRIGDSVWAAGVAGIVKTAAREWPGASLKAIDIADPNRAADGIVNELFEGGPAIEVGFAADGSRHIVRLQQRHETYSGRPALPPGSVLVVSGGARGVTATCVARLAAAWKLRLVLIGRSRPEPWPPGLPLSNDLLKLTKALAADAEAEGKVIDLATLRREARVYASRAELINSLADLEALGIEHLYFAADIADESAVEAALERARQQWGPIAGIVHGAGVLADKEIADLSEQQFQDVFRTKVSGFAALLAATRHDPIQLIGVFSSVAARSGNVGQAAYAAANEVLNKLAAREAQRRGSNVRVRSFNWGPWDGGMVDASLKAHFERQGVKLIEPDVGAGYFQHELETPGDGVERVVVADSGFAFPTQTFELACDGSAAMPERMVDIASRICTALAPSEEANAWIEGFAVADNVTPAQLAGIERLGITTAPLPAAPTHVRLSLKDASGQNLCSATLRFDAAEILPLSPPSAGFEAWISTSLRQQCGTDGVVTLEGISDEGGVALIQVQHALGDGAIGAGLSLAALWAHDRLGRDLRCHRVGVVSILDGEMPARVRCAFRVRYAGDDVVFDFSFATDEGTPLVEIRDAEFVAGA